jgi:ubiquinone/menaquinone biosynthesis C-methylase UbiE
MDPDGLVAPLVEPGMRVLEVGAGTGFVTVPLAEQVGPGGRIWCIDVQARMLAALERRLRRRKLADRITTRVCEAEDLCVSDLAGSVDLAVLVYVLHEVPDPARTLQQTAATLRVGGRLLLVEPKGHCSPELFAEEIRIARALNLVPCDDLVIKKARSRLVAVFERRQ